MRSFLFFCSLLLISLGCSKSRTDQACFADSETDLTGVWVVEGDGPDREPADTLRFTRNGNNTLLSFYCDGSPGPDWPEFANTPYRFQQGKLSYLDYSNQTGDEIEVESFQWVEPGRSFSVLRYEILTYISADYRVRYTRLPCAQQ